MSFYLTDLYGVQESNPSERRMKDVLASLVSAPTGHPDVSLMHESQWTLSVFANGLLVWENIEEDSPKHMKEVSCENVLKLWIMLSKGNLDVIHQEAWKDGYGQ